MQRKSLTAGIIVVIALALALVYGGWQMLESERQQACAACGRPLHSHSSVVALIDGEEQSFCCLACVYMDHRQTGHEAKVVELTDYYSDAAIKPEDAFLVVGSSVNHCLRVEPILDQHKLASQLDFDRCAPSVLAFSSEAEARNFIESNGGALQTFADLEPALRR